MENEDRLKILSLLYDLLQETRAGRNISELSYHVDDNWEYVKIRFEKGGHKIVDVTADSGISMIRDVLRVL